MDLDELRAFIAVVETGSYAAAARSLGFARATLRRRIDELEARAGVPLFRRGTGALQPTPAGSLLASRGGAVLADARALVSSIKALGDAPPELEIVALPGPPSELIRLAATHLAPTLRVRFTFAEDPSVLPDGFVVGFDLAREAPRGKLVATPLASVRIGLAATAAFVAEAKIRTIEDARKHPIACWRNREGDLDRLVHVDGREIPIRPVLFTSDVTVLDAVASAGRRLVYGPRFPTSSALVSVLPNVVGQTVTMRMLVPGTGLAATTMKELVTRLGAFVARVHETGKN